MLPYGKVRQLGRLTRLVSGKLFHDLVSVLTMDFMFTSKLFFVFGVLLAPWFGSLFGVVVDPVRLTLDLSLLLEPGVN